MPFSDPSVSVPGIDGEYSRKKILITLMLPLAMSLIAVSMINVALPSIEHGLGASQAHLQWVIAGYALVFGMVLVPAGRLGDLMGRSLFLVVGIVIFNVGALACALAQDPVTLNLFRLIQGFGAGFIGPQAVGIIQQYFTGAVRARAFAIFGMTVSVAVAIGPLLSGSIIEAIGPGDGWRAAFVVNIPIGIAAVVAAAFWLPWGRERQFFAILKRHRINTGQLDPTTHDKPTVPSVPGTPSSLHLDLDPVGMILLAAAVLCTMMPFMNTAHPLVFALLVVAIVLFIAWAKWERSYKASGRAPMVDMDLFSHSTYTNGTAVSGIYFLGGTSIFVLAALYMQDGLGLTALQTGLMTLPNATVSGLSAMVIGRYAYEHARTLLFGCHMFIVAGLAGLALTAVIIERADASPWWLILPTVVIGIGQGGLGSCNQIASLMDVPAEMGGAAGGVKQTAERIGTAVGSAIITAIFYGALGEDRWTRAFFVGLIGIIAFILVSAAINLYDRHINGAGVDR